MWLSECSWNQMLHNKDILLALLHQLHGSDSGFERIHCDLYEESINNMLVFSGTSTVQFCQMKTCIWHRRGKYIFVRELYSKDLSCHHCCLLSRKQFVTFFNVQDFLIYDQLSGCVTWDIEHVRVSGNIELPFKGSDSCRAEICSVEMFVVEA